VEFSLISKRAFDTVNHNILIAMLEHYGVGGNALQWLKSYLYYRDQFLSKSWTKSTPFRVTSGVPQWHVLGPLLSLKVINDMPKAPKKIEFYIFVDDTSIHYEFETWNEMIKQVNKELQLVKKWLDAGTLLSVDKLCYNSLYSN